MSDQQGSTRAATSTETGRRRQLVACAVEVIATQGLAGASPARVAAVAGVSKAAVLYHFSSREALLDQVFTTVTSALVTEVGSAVEAADGPTDQLEAYLRSLVAHVAADPVRARARALAQAVAVRRGSPSDAEHVSRWAAVAGILQAGQRTGVMGQSDARTVAVLLGGALDALVAEWLDDPTFDVTAGADSLVAAARAITA